MTGRGRHPKGWRFFAEKTECSACLKRKKLRKEPPERRKYFARNTCGSPKLKRTVVE